MKRFFLIVALCLLGNVSVAVFLDGNEIYSRLQECEKIERNDGSGSSAKCNYGMGYVTGVYDTAESNGVICGSSTAQVGQARDVVYLWLKNNPAKRSYSAESLVVAALEEAWPCPQE